jgi:hypothetical protein
MLICIYVLISHSFPFPNPTGLIAGIGGYVFGGTTFGEYLGEY